MLVEPTQEKLIKGLSGRLKDLLQEEGSLNVEGNIKLILSW